MMCPTRACLDPMSEPYEHDADVSAGLLIKWPSIWLLLLALEFSIVILIGVLGTRLETVPHA